MTMPTTPRSRDAADGASTGQFTLTLNGQEVPVAEVPELPERGLTSLTYDYRTAIQVRSVDDLDGRVLLHEILHALLRTDPQQVCPADDPRHEDFVRMLTAGLHDAAGYRRAVRPSPDSEAVARVDDREVEAAIREWAEPDDELGWPGAPEVAQHAEEISDFLWEQGLLR